jgi:hypothetical protein
MPQPGEIHRTGTTVMSALMVVIGIAMVASTLARGGGPIAIGVLLGVLFLLAGAGRLYVGRRPR